MAAGVLRSIRFGVRRQSKRAATEVLRQRETVVEETDHAEPGDGLK
jgi:hypothetical protein